MSTITKVYPPDIATEGHVPEGAVYVGRPEDNRFLSLVSPDIGPPGWINIVASRLMGKSSLLHRASRTLLATNHALVICDLYYELDNVAKANPDVRLLIRRIVVEWRRKAEAAIRRRGLVPLSCFTVLQAERKIGHSAPPARLLLGLIAMALLPLAPADWRWTFVLDEIDCLGYSPFDYGVARDIVSAIRGCLDEAVSAGVHKRFGMAFAGLRPFGAFCRDSSDHFEPSFRPEPLRDFACDANTVEAFMAAFDEPSAQLRRTLKQLVQMTGGHPQMTSILAAALRRRLRYAPGNRRSVRRDNLSVLLHRVADEEMGKNLAHTFQVMEHLMKGAQNGAEAMALYKRLLREEFLPAAPNQSAADALDTCGMVRFIKIKNREFVSIKAPLIKRRFTDEVVTDIARYYSRPKRVAAGRYSHLDQIVLFPVGGTICMKWDPKRGKNIFVTDSDELIREIPGREELAPLKVEVIEQLDSINIFPSNWTTLVERIRSFTPTHLEGERVSGVVIAMGTDTLADTASALALALPYPRHFPVVVTGAQTPLNKPGGDAKSNLFNACRVAMERNLPEVVVVFGGQVLRASRVVKVHDFDFKAFESPGVPALGTIGEDVRLRRIAVAKPPLFDPRKHRLEPTFATHVMVIRLSPGLETDLYAWRLTAPKLPPVEGVIIQAPGAGNVPDRGASNFSDFVKNAIDLEIPVLITSEPPVDPDTYKRYGVGAKAVASGAIPGFNMTAPAAAAKFRLLLGQRSIIHKSWDERMRWITTQMLIDFAGETLEHGLPHNIQENNK